VTDLIKLVLPVPVFPKTAMIIGAGLDTGTVGTLARGAL
jgi:hypothetical protein